MLRHRNAIWHFAAPLCKIADMNWNDLSALVAVSRAHSLIGAARILQVDQATVSRRLRALEASLGVQLLVRHREGVALTEAGFEAARSAEVIETVVHDLERKLAGADSQLAGLLRVTTLDTMTQYHPDLFATFAEQHPAVELEVETNSTRRSLARREADVAIRWTMKPAQDLFGRRLVRAEFALYAARSLRDSIGRRARLSSYPWLAYTRSSNAVLTEQFMEEHVPGAKVACRYDDTLAMHAAIRAGVGVGFVPCAFADPNPELVRLRGVEPDFGYDIWCLTHPDLRATGRVRAFMAHVGEYFASRAKLYAGNTRGRASR